MGGGKVGKFGKTEGELLDQISNALTAASLIPGVDTFADLAAIPVDLLRGDYVSAGLDLLGVIPIAGEAADAAKLVRLADKTADAAKAGKLIPTTSLIKTHRLTRSTKQYKGLVNDIRKNGITDAIKVVEHKGKHYVVDGHHRLQAAKELKIKQVPIEKVTLPYKGYKTIDDLLWFE